MYKSTNKLAPAIQLLVATAVLIGTACGLDDREKNSCSQPEDCVVGFQCNSETSSCERTAEVADAGTAQPGADAEVVPPADACVPSIVGCDPGQCGAIPNGCGQFVMCGGCSDEFESCGGGGANNVCGCTPESDAEFCEDAGLSQCGAVDAVDRCGNARNISCGVCTANDQCGNWAKGFCDQVVCTGANWCRSLNEPLVEAKTVRSIWGNPAGETYISVSDNMPSGRILLHDGSQLTVLAEGEHQLAAVGGADGELLCVSSGGEILSPSSGGLSEIYSSIRNWRNFVALSPNDIWVVGAGTLHARMAHFDGSIWTESEYDDLYSEYRSISAVASNHIWAVGFDVEGGFQYKNEGSLAAFYNGVDWTVDYDLPNDNYLHSVWAAAVDDVWAVGESGTILHFDGAAWAISDSGGVTQNLYAVTKVGNDVWAAGSGGLILKLVGVTWVPQQSGTTRTIRALWANDVNDIWAGGDNGLLLHYQP